MKIKESKLRNIIKNTVNEMVNENIKSELESKRVRISESQLNKLIKESMVKILTEDSYDIPYNVNEVVKLAYKLRGKIRQIYEACDYGESAYTGKLPRRGLSTPNGFDGANGEIEKLLYDAYYSVDRMIKDLKAASTKFSKELEAEFDDEFDGQEV